MKRIKVKANTASIDEAIKILRGYKARFEDKGNKESVLKMFLEECADRLIEKANRNVSLLNIDTAIKNEIMSSWETTYEKGGKIIIHNKSQESASIEYGIGQVGEGTYDYQFGADQFDYNVPSRYKRTDKETGEIYWTFKNDGEPIDIPHNFYESFSSTDGNEIIRSSGFDAQLYMFHAIMEFQQRQEYKPIWEKVKKKCLI